MTRWWYPLALGMLVIGVCLGPVVVVHAASFASGDQVEISALNSILATLWGLLAGSGGKLLGGGLIARGFGKMGSGNPNDKPLANIGGGLGIAFVPALISTTFDAAPAAAGVLAPVASLLERSVAGFLGLRLLQDPVFWVVLLMTVLTMELLQQRRQVRLA